MKSCFNFKYNVMPVWPYYLTTILNLYHIIVAFQKIKETRTQIMLTNIPKTNQAGLANVHSLLISFLTFQREGRSHSVFVSNSSVWHLLLHTPSATFFEKHSWRLYITLALNAVSPQLCFSVWCRWIKDSISLFSQFLPCSPLVFKLWAVSTFDFLVLI